MRLQGSPKASRGFGLLTALCLAGCAAGYPELSSVPSEPRPSLPVEQRREIVRGLIKERDESRRQTSLVRGRSGLSTSAFEKAGDGDAEAEAIIPDEPGEAKTFTLRGESGSEDEPVSTYRSGAQFDDGSLDDFIRRLERDTTPEAPAVLEEPASEEALGDDETSFHFLDVDGASPVLLAAFAPVDIDLHDFGRDGIIRLAASADEDDRSAFCYWLGWAVGVLGACLRENGEPPAETNAADDVEEGSKADIEDEARRLQQEENAGNGGEADPETPAPSRREQAEQRLSEQDASEAIENLGRGALEPVRSSLEKLRDFMRARRSADPEASPAERRAYRNGGGTSPDDVLADYPPLPMAKPKVRSDLKIRDDGEKFEFKRLSPPAFKPTAADEPVIFAATGPGAALSEEVIFPPERPVRTSKRAEPATEKRRPAFRPDDLVGEEETTAEAVSPSGTPQELERLRQELIEGLTRAQEESLSAAGSAESEEQSSDLAALPPSSEPEPAAGEVDESLDWSTPQFIELTPGSSAISPETMDRLRDILTYAKANGQKIQLVGEAGTTRLAARRATEVGAALVRLSATAEILEYDFNVVPGVDRVRLELLPPKPEDGPNPADAG
jgi:hypothetical protein